MAVGNLWSELEALRLSTDFLPSAVVANKLGVHFTLGATMAVRRASLAEIGGFEALADMAAEDHELGSRLAARGHEVELVDAPIETECTSQSLLELFRHQVRWAVVTRDSKPWGHLGFILAQGLPWTLAAVAVAPSRAIGAGYLMAYLLLRLAVAFRVGAWGLQDSLVRKRWWLLPLSDALGFAVWLSSLFKHRVYWQHLAYDVRRGRLIQVPANSRGSAAPQAESNASFTPESCRPSKPVR
jgi:ceramide glucosyltransferase